MDSISIRIGTDRIWLKWLVLDGIAEKAIYKYYYVHVYKAGTSAPRLIESYYATHMHA